VNGYIDKNFQGQRSKVKVTAISNAALQHGVNISTVWRRGSLVIAVSWLCGKV